MKDNKALDKISKEYIEKAKKEDILIEDDFKTLKNQIDMDIRENIPPQLMSIVSGIVNIVEKIEVDNEDKKK
ncbi:MAG: hypothetical protein ACQEQE_02675 [Bacillota bacterium]